MKTQTTWLKSAAYGVMALGIALNLQSAVFAESKTMSMPLPKEEGVCATGACPTQVHHHHHMDPGMPGMMPGMMPPMGCMKEWGKTYSIVTPEEGPAFLLNTKTGESWIQSACGKKGIEKATYCWHPMATIGEDAVKEEAKACEWDKATGEQKGCPLMPHEMSDKSQVTPNDPEDK